MKLKAEEILKQNITRVKEWDKDVLGKDFKGNVLEAALITYGDAINAIQQALSSSEQDYVPRVGDDVLIDNDYRAIVLEISEKNNYIGIFDYCANCMIHVERERVSLTIGGHE